NFYCSSVRLQSLHASAVFCDDNPEVVSVSSEEIRANDELTDQPLEETPEAAAEDSELDEGNVTEEQVAQEEAAAEPDQEEEPSLDVQLERAEARADEYLESLQRERASFQNYRKRVEAERAQQAERVRGDVLLRLLPVLDDFYRATEAVPEDSRDSWYEGILLILRKLERFLEDQGVQEIPALGEKFDPNFHEAVGVDDSTDAEPETIVDVLQRGYQQNDRVLRPALVRVAQ